eukprot:3705159-Amphidinium_carterae.1
MAPSTNTTCSHDSQVAQLTNPCLVWTSFSSERNGNQQTHGKAPRNVLKHIYDIELTPWRLPENVFDSRQLSKTNN